MLSGEGNAGERWKTTIGLISKKATLHVQHTFLYISLPLFCTTTMWNFQKLLSFMFFEGKVIRVLVHFFSLPRHWPIFTLHWWPLAFLLSLPPLQNFHVVIPTKKCLLFFISRSRSLLLFFSLSFTGLPLTLSFLGAVCLLLFISNLWTWQLI